MTEDFSFDVFVLGSANVDLIANVSDLPKRGETIFGSNFTTEFGGKGANQAIQCAKLGANVAICCKLGSDSHGDSYLSHFLSERVSQRCILRGSHHTGTAIITVSISGDNTIVVIPGSNSDLSASDVQTFQKEITLSSVFICQNEVPYETNLVGLTLAKELGCFTILNTAPANSAMNHQLFQFTDVICPNEVELATLSGLSTDTQEEVRLAAIKLFQNGSLPSTSHLRCVLVTLGSRGACAVIRSPSLSPLDSTEEETTQLPFECIFLPADEVRAIDTVGAGDSFLGALGHALSSLIKSHPSSPSPPSESSSVIDNKHSFLWNPKPSSSLSNTSFASSSSSLPSSSSSHSSSSSSSSFDCLFLDAVRFALKCASISVTRSGVQRSYPTLEELPLELRSLFP